MTNDQKSEVEEHEVKKLILIGNGFDLALGLPTGYSAFILRLIKKYLQKTFEGELKKHSFYKNQFSHNLTSHNGYLLDIGNSVQIFAPNKWSADLGDFLKQIEEKKSIYDLKELMIKNNIEIVSSKKGIHKNSLLIKVLNQPNSGWVDIEQEYFGIFKSIIDSKKNRLNLIRNLNQELDLLTNELHNYLIEFKETVYEHIPLELKRKIFNQFLQPVNPNKFISKQNVENKSEELIYLINFNYTRSLQDDIFTKMQTINIHGIVNEHNPNITFGYGDEMDEDYKKIENLNDNEYLRKFKSFGYFQAPNYRKLLNIVNSGPFDVVIYGHSCGLSDRVLLNEIFEHKYCRFIRVYYHQDKNDYVDKTMNISRHFNSNKLMRQRVIDFQEEDKIPQRSDYE